MLHVLAVPLRMFTPERPARDELLKKLDEASFEDLSSAQRPPALCSLNSRCPREPLAPMYGLKSCPEDEGT